MLEIWNSSAVQEIRRGLNQGYAPFCLNCGLKRPLRNDEAPQRRGVIQDCLPRIFLEPTVVCNLNCRGAVCSKDSKILASRSRHYFPRDELLPMLVPVGKQLIRIDFFNYGDPFCHPEAVSMLKDIKASFPGIYLYTSTNGLLLTDEKMVGLIRSGLDEITFSVDGADQKTYERYRRNGQFPRVLAIMRRFMELRRQDGAETPFVNWRYILFRWNDSSRQMNKARRLARKIGLDRLTWEITDHPEDAFSRKFFPGTRGWERIRFEIWDTSQIGSAIKGNRFIARFTDIPQSIRMKVGEAAAVDVAVQNRGGALWPERTRTGRRMVRLGAQLYSIEGNRLDLNYSRAFLPMALSGGKTGVIRIELPPLPGAGEYQLKWDMVSEGNDWFENGGSPVAWTRLKCLPE